METTFNMDNANATLDSIEKLLDGIMVFHNTLDNQESFTYEEYVEFRALLDQVNAAIDAYYTELNRRDVDPESSFLTALLYGSWSRIDTIEKAESTLSNMEEVLGLNNKEGEPKTTG